MQSFAMLMVRSLLYLLFIVGVAQIFSMEGYSQLTKSDYSEHSATEKMHDAFAFISCVVFYIAINLQPDHLSWYQLTIEPNTEFHAKPPSLPVDETLWNIQEHGQARIADAGFSQYEISAYAKDKNKRSRHNLNYWTFGDYLGIGAGAHGKITLLSEQKVLRRWKQKQPKAYMEPSTRLQGCEAIAENELGFEFMLNVLRLSEGVPSKLFTERTGLALEHVQSEITEARRRKLLVDNVEIIKPTIQGRLFLNDLLGIFL